MSSQAPAGNRFGEIAVREGFASRAAVRECLEIQTKLKSFGVEPKRLGEIMVEKGYLRDEDVRAILEVQRMGGSRIESRSGTITEVARQKQLKASQTAARGLGHAAPQIPGYQVLELLGEGGMGMVYRARQKSLDRIVALKILPPRAARESSFIKRFIAEARTVARLNHENIIAGIDVGEANGTYYFAMEHVEGESVADMIERTGALEERTALQIAAQIARALEHAHKHGLVHRDVKPQNILVTKNQLAKLCDLGLAKMQNESGGDPQGVPVGTPHYLSPEQARGEADVDIRSDIYSLGATLYHMLTGLTPFEGQSPMVLMTKHLTEEPVPARKRNAGVSKHASELIAWMMAKEKEDRPQTPTEVLEEIERILSGKKLSTSQRTSGSGRTSGRRKRPGTKSAAREPVEESVAPERRRRGGRAMVRRGGGAETASLIMIPAAVLILAGLIVSYFVLGSGPKIQGLGGPRPTSEVESEAKMRLLEYRDLERVPGREGEARAGYEEIMRTYPGTQAASLAQDYLREMNGGG